MIKKFLTLCILQSAVFGFSQNMRPVAQKVSQYHTQKKDFEKFDLFTINKNSEKLAEYKRAATDISVLNIDSKQLKKLVHEKPEYLEISFPFNEKVITLELYKNQIFTNDFKVTTNKGEIVDYTPGAYYQGIVKGDNQSVVAFSFFEDDVVGVASTPELGNVILGKVKNSTDFVSYSDSKLTGLNPFVCGVDELTDNHNQKISFDPDAKKTTGKVMTQNCVRIYYEVCYTPYTNNGSNTTTTANWLTAIHNNISTLYSNDDIKIALNEIYVWTTADPYTGTPNANLASFRTNRQTFNGDLAHLVNQPSTTSVAYINSLCTTSRHAYSGASQTYNNVPVYSWTIEAMTHEMGHSLGSPHTHACAWNGNSTAIDGCGTQAGYPEGTCATGPIPSSTVKGTIMSYCHLVSGVGINFANGFGPQPAALIRNTVESKPCLGMNCTTACSTTVTSLSVSNITQISANAAFTDATSASWKYRLTKYDGTVVSSGTTSTQSLSMANLQPATYYLLSVGTDCSAGYQRTQMFLTDGDWCDGAQFTDTGGTTSNYGDSQTIVKTFYPSSGALTMNFTEFGLEQDYDFMYIYNGPSTSSPLFANGNGLTGTALPGTFTSTHPSGAITVRFVSDPAVNDIGWKANFSCAVLAVEDVNTKDNTVNIYPNPARNIITISSKDALKSFKIYDEAGRLIKSESSLKGNKHDVTISSMQTGNYVVTVETEKQKITKKLIKQ
ncbi:T9SS type A sorting domain-containing protein [Chryseobacterium gambrini]|uniref:Por secretion system C-terminal sorting domain-containing protein n=1 Tax=Chryseobacterium gambrini TaxID=373672 RepID=A0A1N7K441_9FLAO|nr:T9SS type A sorting domain-containing protein [Chryseobacterium gambrini]WBV53303.1 T9SS type A sorting domain-containing protein [Chryseobacterium gambrini]SIS56365.1 Por secretion system C-terminal sorting domain-containing protein [Chryseobacterium gambrini]